MVLCPPRREKKRSQQQPPAHTHKSSSWIVIAVAAGLVVLAAAVLVLGVIWVQKEHAPQPQEESSSTLYDYSDPTTDEFWSNTLEEDGGDRRAHMIIRFDDNEGPSSSFQLDEHCANATLKTTQEKGEQHLLAFTGNASCKDQLEADFQATNQTTNITVAYDYPIEAFRLHEPPPQNVQTTITPKYKYKKQRKLLPLNSGGRITPWGMKAIGLQNVTYGTHKKNVTICIADTGIDLAHPGFSFFAENSSSSFIAGADAQRFWESKPWKWDEDRNGHGTFVAGILTTLATTGGSNATNGFQLFVTRALGDDGRGYESDAIHAMEKCVANGADIINLSFGSPFKSPFLDDFMARLKQRHPNLLLIGASGNTGNWALYYPSAYPQVLSVAASNIDHNRHWFSTTNRQVEFAGPGHSILSTTTAEAMVRLDSSGFRFPSRFVSHPNANVSSISGLVVDCGTGSLPCGGGTNDTTAAGKICLLEQTNDSPAIPQMIQNCQAAQGIGAILFSTKGGNYRKWNPNEKEHDLQIIAVGVNNAVGLELKYGSNHDFYGNGVMGRARAADEKGLPSVIGQAATIGRLETEADRAYVYGASSGTSLAATHVSAVAAYLLSHKGHICDANQIRYAMAATAYNPNNVCDSQLGHGIVHAGRALEFLETKFDCTKTPIPHWRVRGGCSLVGATPLY